MGMIPWLTSLPLPYIGIVNISESAGIYDTVSGTEPVIKAGRLALGNSAFIRSPISLLSPILPGWSTREMGGKRDPVNSLKPSGPMTAQSSGQPCSARPNFCISEPLRDTHMLPSSAIQSLILPSHSSQAMVPSWLSVAGLAFFDMRTSSIIPSILLPAPHSGDAPISRLLSEAGNRNFTSRSAASSLSTYRRMREPS